MISSSLVLLLAVISCIDSYELTQPESLTVRPDATLTINCKVSYSVTNQHTGWIRQPAGKALEWIGWILSDGRLDYKDSLKSKFSITRDTSSNTITLQGKNMRVEDTAVYYCANGVAFFDYWGKGTQVIVTSEVPKAPNVFIMSSSESSPGSLIVGCLATGFAPAESVRFKWMDQRGNALTNFIQYPTLGTGDKRMKVSHITVNETEWNRSNITCEAGHPSRNVKETLTIVKSQTPTLSLILVTTLKSTSVMCVIEDFYPKMIDVQWMVNNTNSKSPLKLICKQNENTRHYSAYSFYEVSRETWDAKTLYTCEVTQRGKTFNMTTNFKAKFALTLKPPIQKELFVNDKVVLEAVVSGDVGNAVKEALVSCNMNAAVTSGEVKFSEDISQFIQKHNVTVDTKKWFDGEKVTCTIYDKNNNRDIKQEIHFNQGDGQKPTVIIYRPDNETDRVSHVCEVTSPKLGDVYIMWKVGDESYIEGITSAPIHQKDSTSVLSILTMTEKEYNNPSNTISCAVVHANMSNRRSPLQVSTSKSKQPENPCD